jgi:hypothetical protein
MGSNLRRVVLGLLGVFFVLAPAWAHHAVQAEFDFDKPINLTGVITKVEWINPHSYMTMDVKDDTGKVHHWALELVGPGGLRKAGLSRENRGGMKPGDTITITGFAAKDGSETGWVKDIKLSDGRTVEIWTRDPYGR